MQSNGPNPSESEQGYLHVGEVYSLSSDTKRYLRVLWCDPEIIVPETSWLGEIPHVVIIDVLSENAWPQILSYSDAKAAITQQTWQHHEGPDPFSCPFVNQDRLKTNRRDRYNKRRNDLSKLVHLISDQKPQCFIKSVRCSLITQSAAQNSCSPSLARKWLRLFWQSGEDENAFWLRHRFSGATSLEHVLKASPAVLKRRGRPRCFAADAEPKNPEERDWSIPSIEQRGLMKQGFEEYLKKIKNTKLLVKGKRFPWKDARDDVVDTHFGTQTCLVENGRGKRVPTIITTREENKPSISQFKRYIQSIFEINDIIKSVQGTRDYNANYRPKGGDTRLPSIGPGTLYIGDSTLADIFLVSRFSRLPCGRPYVYFIVDYFSRIIVGLLVTYKNPCLEVAKKALFISFTSKKDYAARFNVTLAPGEWDCAHVCNRFQADNGELAGHSSDLFVSTGLSGMANTPPYRGDLNGLDESNFQCANKQIRFLRGHTRGPRERCAPDRSLESQLDIIQFTRILIEWIVRVHNRRIIINYPRTPLMTKFPVATTPIDLWNWGRKYVGRPRKMTPDEIRRRLMPVDQATVKDNGIWFRNVCYYCKIESIASLIYKARLHGVFDISVSFDPEDTNSIEVHTDPEGRNNINVPISSLSIQYKDKTFSEVALDVDDLKSLNRSKSQLNATEARKFRGAVRAVNGEATAALVEKHGDLASRNQMAKLSDKDQLRREEVQMEKRNGMQAPSDLKEASIAPAKRVDLRARFAAEKEKVAQNG